MTRSKNSLFNFITGIVSTLFSVFLNFFTRTIFIRTLGESYLGLEGLFSNILSVLSLAELGFGAAISFKLYKPIEENDRPRILILLKLYRQVYLIIGLFVAVIGFLLIPLLPTLIKDYGTVAELGLNATFIFLLYLFNSVSSYWFFAYKTSFIQANQKSYILNIVGYAVSVASSVCQIVVLYLTHNFVFYLCVQIGFSIFQSFVNALICNRRYPYVKEKTSGRISKEELRLFIKDCSALLLYRASNVVINASDNIVLSALVGLSPVGLYANYLSVKTSIRNLLYSFTTAVQASIGSLYTTGNTEWSRLVFRVIVFLSIWFYGVAGIGIAVLMDDFILLWLGDAQFVVTSWTTAAGVTVQTPIALLVGIELYLAGQAYYCGTFRNAMGLFQELKWRPVFTVLINLLFSILLVPRIGIAGCVVSTIIAHLASNLLIDPIIIHKCALKTSSIPYFLRCYLYGAVLTAAGALCFWVCSLISLTGWLGLIVRGCICVLLPSAIFAACFFRTQEFRFTLQTAIGLIPARFRRGNPQ